MIQTNTHSFAHQRAARLGPNHGYRIDGDIALLHAEVAVEAAATAQRDQWALQLWACETPFNGGSLHGVKIAEAALPLSDAAALPQRLDAEALARIPGGQRDYSMVLVLASGAPGAFDQIHDFANYPARERFITPHLDGGVGYQLDGGDVVLRAESIRNPRAEGNLSGSLALELWAVADAYRGGMVENGQLLASADVGRITGEGSIHAFEQRVKFNTPAAGRWQVVMMLREWVAGGYVTRDFCTFGQEYVVAEPQVPVQVKPRTELPKPANDATNGTPRPAAVATLAQPMAAPAVVEAKPAVVAAKPAVVEAKPAVVAAKPAVVEAKPAVVAAKPAVVEIKPAVVAAKPAVVEIKPAVVEIKPSLVEAKPAGVAEAKPTEGRVSITTGTLEELALLPGLTRKIAVEIVKGRPYTSVDDLTRVRGIGPKLLVKVRSQLTL